MDPVSLAQLRSYLTSLDERSLRNLILEFYLYQNVDAVIVHGAGEHGVDVLAYVDVDRDFLRRGYNVLVQVKKGDLTLPRWRNEVQGQLTEATYSRHSHHLYIDHHARRLLLFVAGSASSQARDSIRDFNRGPGVRIEMWELDELIMLFEKTDFASRLLERVTFVGTAQEMPEPGSPPPVVGEERGDTQSAGPVVNENTGPGSATP